MAYILLCKYIKAVFLSDQKIPFYFIMIRTMQTVSIKEQTHFNFFLHMKAEKVLLKQN